MVSSSNDGIMTEYLIKYSNALVNAEGKGAVLLETLYMVDSYRAGKDLKTAREDYDRAMWDGISSDELEARLVDLAGFMGGLARDRFEMWGIKPEV
jgi:hypothetical protein